MDLQMTASGKSSAGSLTVSDVVFQREYNEALLHQVVVAYQACGRQNSKGLKNRAAVRGGGVKPWRQKGTGRARAGTIRSPLWRSGGATFGTGKANYKQKINKKMYVAAMRVILSELVRQDRLLVLKDFTVETPKTKELIEKLQSLALTNVLIITEGVDSNLHLAARNIPNVSTTDVTAVDPVSLLGYERVLATSAVIKQLEEKLA